MSSISKTLVLCLIGALYGCTNDDDSESLDKDSEIPPIDLPAITVLGDTDLIEYQTDIEVGLQAIHTTNLNEEIGFGQQLYLLDSSDQLITFVTRFDGQTSAWQRNISTGEIYQKQDFCPQKGVFSVATATGSERYLTYLFDDFEDIEDRYFLEVYDKDLDSCKRYDLGLGRPAAVRQYGPIYMVYRVPSIDQKELLVVNLGKEDPLTVLSLEDDFNFATVNDQDLYLFFIDGSYEIYDINSLELIQEGGNTVLSKTSEIGFLSTNFKDGKMRYYEFFPQPSTILFTPRVYDFSTDSVIEIGVDLFKLKTELESQLSTTISFQDIEIDFDRNLLFIGYAEIQPSVKGGIAYTYFNGDLINFITLPHYPRQILIKK